MKKRIFLVLGVMACSGYLTSCLDEDSDTFVPSIAETNNSYDSYYSKDGDTIPPEDDDSTSGGKDTGGEEGQLPVRP